MSHLLWLVVLVKCVTPPLWSSSSGLFCWLQSPREVVAQQVTVATKQSLRNWNELLDEARDLEQVLSTETDDRDLWANGSEPIESLLSVSNLSIVEARPHVIASSISWPRVLLGLWIAASLGVISVAIVRWLQCWRMLRNAPQRECSELAAQLEALAKRLRVRRRVRLIVTESRIGPAVIGLFRTTVLLPALIVDRLALRSRHAPRDEPNAHQNAVERQRSVKRPAHHAERDGYVDGDGCEENFADSPLAPILAHELLHIRRGDLWVGLLQTLAQAVWWCHPLVWWVNRLTTREAERCCDEEVLAELGCDPSAYARALVDVLELKRELKAVPIFPGVRPVEITSQRLERIMKLGQGCRRRTPWWCWLIAALAAALTWPGAAFVVTAEDEEFKTQSFVDGGTVVTDSPIAKSDETATQSIHRGGGVNSNAGLSGEIVLEESTSLPTKRTHIEQSDDGRVSGVAATAKTKLELDGLGQLLWQHGSWFIVIRPEPGKKLIDLGESPSKFRSDGPVSVRLSKTAQGFSSKDQIRIMADEFNLWSDASGEQIRFGGDVWMDGNGFRANSKSLVLSFHHQPEGLVREPQITATLREEVQLLSKTNREATELKASRMLLYLNGTAMTNLQSDENGIVSVLRDPPARDAELIRRGQDILAGEKLLKRISVRFEKEPLRRVIEHLAKESGRNIHLDAAGLIDQGLTDTELVTLKFTEVTLPSAVALLLEPLNLGYRVEESGVIVVTSRQRLKGEPIVLTYSVADLAVPASKRWVMKLTPIVGSATKDRKLELVHEGSLTDEGRTKFVTARFQELTELITKTCAPDSWEAVGGNGRIQANAATLSLVVRQTRDVHGEIKDLLQQLRRLHDLQAALTIETLNVPDDFWLKVGKEFEVAATDVVPNPQPPSKDNPSPRGMARLSKKETALLRSLSQPSCQCKVTLLNAQELDLLIGQEPAAMRLGLKPIVSGDQKVVRLQAVTVKPNAVMDFAELPNISLEDGQSLLLDATEVFPTVPAVGAKVTYLDRLFKNAGPSVPLGRTLLLITSEATKVESEKVRAE